MNFPEPFHGVDVLHRSPVGFETRSISRATLEHVTQRRTQRHRGTEAQKKQFQTSLWGEPCQARQIVYTSTVLARTRRRTVLVSCDTGHLDSACRLGTPTERRDA